MATNKTLLAKGLRNLGFVVLLFIISPLALTMSFKALNKFSDEKLLLAYIFIAISGILIIISIIFAFKTFKILLNALFDD